MKSICAKWQDKDIMQAVITHVYGINHLLRLHSHVQDDVQIRGESATTIMMSTLLPVGRF